MNKKVEYEERYISYLANLVCDEYHYRDFTRLIHMLYYREFTYTNEKDENRALDGLALRERFIDECGTRLSQRYLYFPERCTVLEMLVAFACRIEQEIMSEPDLGDRSPKWFWVMLRNCDLNREDDESLDEGYVNMVLDKVLNREYDRHGKGSFFYLPNSSRDARKMELWDQMCRYLNDYLKVAR